MKSTIGLALLVTVLQVAHCQKVQDLQACLKGQQLRLDCLYERKTSNDLGYEFRLSRDTRPRVVASNVSVIDNAYKARTNVTTPTRNRVCLYLDNFSVADEGTYACHLKIPNDYTVNQTKTITVVKDRLEKCAGISHLIQNTSWLLLLLLSLPLLQAVDFVSL